MKKGLPPRNGVIAGGEIGALIMALGHCVASVSVVNDEVFVTKVVRGDAFGQQRLGLAPDVDCVFTFQLDDGWERDAVLRHFDPPPSMYEPEAKWAFGGFVLFFVLMVFYCQKVF
jgi:hypothetical protein